MKTLSGIRPSLWARCPTAAVFQGRGELEAELPPETSEWFARGNLFEEYVARQIVAKHGRENVERQVVIPIEGIGEGHADAYIRPAKTLVEVKSTVAPYPNSDIFGHGVRQLRIYTAHHDEAEQGALYMVNPNTLKPADVYTVKLTEEDRGQIADEREYIVRGAAGGELDLEPHGSDYRPCVKPSQARGRMCPFARACFGDDWQPPEPTEIPDPHVLDLVSRLAALKDEKRVHAAAAKALEEGEKEIQAELAELVDEGESQVGPFRVRRTHVVMRPKFSERAFVAAGHSLEPLAEFFAGGSEHDRWAITREGNGEIDYGEEAPF